MFDIKKEQCGDEYRYTITIDLGFEKITGTSDNLGGAVHFLSSNIDSLLWCYFNNFSTIKRIISIINTICNDNRICDNMFSSFFSY